MTELFRKYKDVLFYAVFGILTTAVNIAVYWIFAHPLHCSVMVSTIAAWIAAVLFAYVTNRRWVFHSSADTKDEIIRELISFFACRLATGALDWGMMFVFADMLHLNDMYVKLVANVVVIIANYIASKLVIFKKR